MTIKALIAVLNSLTTGEMSRLVSRVTEVRDAAQEMGLPDVVVILDAALRSLSVCDLKAFRKQVQHAVSRLGHAREPVTARA